MVILIYTCIYNARLIPQTVTCWPHSQPVTRWPHSQPVTRWPHSQPVTRWPHFQPVTRWPHFQPVTRWPHSQPIARWPHSQPVFPSKFLYLRHETRCCEHLWFLIIHVYTVSKCYTQQRSGKKSERREEREREDEMGCTSLSVTSTSKGHLSNK